MPTVGATCKRGQLTGSVHSAAHDSGGMDFTSYLGGPHASGFTSNQRPAIYYKPCLDLIDNPQIGLLLSDSFTSQTKRHYQQPLLHSDPSGPLPNLISREGNSSGFHQLRSHLKTQSVQAKTEYQRVFVPHRLTPAASQIHVTVGPQRASGFTEGEELHINTFQEKNRHTVEPRRIHSSVTRTDFLPPSLLQAAESIPALRCRSSRESGFTRGAVAPLACPSSLLTPPQNESRAKTGYAVGNKEPTGSLRNAPNSQALPNAPFDRSHFITHYKSKFCRVDLVKPESGGIITSHMENGYTRRDMDRFIFRR